MENGSVHRNRYDGRCKGNELKIQMLLEHHPLWGENKHAKHLPIKHL